MTIEEYIHQNGTKAFGEFVGAFIRKAPEFDGDHDLAKKIGKLIGDLDCVFSHYEKTSKEKPK